MKDNVPTTLGRTLPTNIINLLPEFKQEKTQKYTMLILTLVALCVFGIFAISPTLGTITELQKEIQDNQYALNSLTTKITVLTTLHREYAALQDDLPYVYAAVPKTPDVPLLTAQVQTIAQTNLVTINAMQVSEVELLPSNTTGNLAYSYSFAVDADGTQEHIMSFLNQLTAAQRIITFNTVALHQNSKDPGSIVADIKAKAYFIP